MEAADLLLRNDARAVLTRQGLVMYFPGKAMTIRLSRRESELFIGETIDWESVYPDVHCEIAHLEITGHCNMGCDYCYVPKHGDEDLTTESWKTILAMLSAASVFQVTFGGGEPLLRPDVFELAEYAKRCGFSVSMTTNGTLVSAVGLALLRVFDLISVSWHGEIDEAEHHVKDALGAIRCAGVSCAVNFVYLKRYEDALPRAIEQVKSHDGELVVLAPKLDPEHPDYVAPNVVLTNIVRYADDVDILVDGLTLCGMGDYCYQSTRFCDVDNIGNVLPCSFIRQPIGNLLGEASFSEIWNNRPPKRPCPYLLGGARQT